MRLRYHPRATEWLEALATAEELSEVFGEVMALLTALEEFGRELGGAESGPIHSSLYDMHELRRTPPSTAAPYATEPPIIRILYTICEEPGGAESAVLLVAGDKTDQGNAWYPQNIAIAEARLQEYVTRFPDVRPLPRRG